MLEDSLPDLVFSFQYVVPGMEHRSSGLVAFALSCPTVLKLNCLVLRNLEALPEFF